ncbi:MAG TPA: DUF2254 domain-containing protein, partial [Pseudoxanthomonas sp.]|nr:DUF2254 domain-containing protein [Pseudoxanthomonas sp.]
GCAKRGAGRASSSMSTRRQWRWRQVARKLWVRAAVFSLLAAGMAILAIFVEPDIPKSVSRRIGAESVGDLLDVIAASMLSVSIFSMTTVVAALSLATSTATPRSTRLLSEDPASQNALATFIGSFIFSLVGIIALQTGLYDERGRITLYLVTVAVIVIIVVTLLRWMEHVFRLGMVGYITEQIEMRTAHVLRAHHGRPFLGGTPWPSSRPVPAGAAALYARQFGYVQHVDMHALHALLERTGGTLFIDALPGAYADAARPLAWLAGAAMDEETRSGLRRAFTVAETRTFDQDPRFGIAVLAEIASRALSPAINDPGTGIDVLGRAERLLFMWSEPEPPEARRIDYPLVHVPPVELDDLFKDAFTPIARDGARMVEIALRLQKTLHSLGMLNPAYAEVARRHSALALERAEAALDFGPDRERVREAAHALQTLPSPDAAQ